MVKSCLNCQKEMVLQKKHLCDIERKKFCSKECLYEFMRKFSPDKKARKTIICKFCKIEVEVIITSKKVYCSNECFKKGHKGSFKLTEEHKKKISETRLRDWASGEVYKNTKSPYCKWYEYLKKDGELIKVQGTWELKYAQWLDQNNIKFLSHKGCLQYKDLQGKERVYLPDFYLIDSDEFVDIKNLFLYNLNENKFLSIRKSNPDVKITVLFKEDLLKLGIKI